MDHPLRSVIALPRPSCCGRVWAGAEHRHRRGGRAQMEEAVAGRGSLLCE